MSHTEKIREHRRRAASAQKRNDWRAAEQVWAKIAALVPDDPDPVVRQINALCRTHDVSTAERLVQNAILRWPRNEELGRLHLRVGKLAASHHRLRAREAEESLDSELAVYHWRELQARVPNHPWAFSRMLANFGLTQEFETILSEHDKQRETLRLYIVGCGRSGTWLLHTMMNCFSGVYLYPKETHVGRFAFIESEAPIHVLKRAHDSYRYLPQIPERIGLIYIVRHPFDVLVSSLGGKQHHIMIERWLSEMAAYRALEAKNRANMLTIRFEDLVTSPDAVQARLVENWKLEIAHKFSRFHEIAKVDPFLSNSMHGLRPLDDSVIYRYRKHPADLDYCRAALDRNKEQFDWVANRFGYDLFP